MIDIVKHPDYFNKKNFYLCSYTDEDVVGKILRECETVIHLAAASRTESQWEDVLDLNIISLKSFLDLCVKYEVKQFIFASTNHVVGDYEVSMKPHIYFRNMNLQVSAKDFCPDSFYGASKLFGEGLGCYYARKYGIQFISLRIGAVLEKLYDHPYGYAEIAYKNKECERFDLHYRRLVRRLKALWLSHADLINIMQCALKYEKTNYEVCYALSSNTRGWLELKKTMELLKYNPVSSSEEFCLKKIINS